MSGLEKDSSEKHPAFGLASFSRQSIGGVKNHRLFGSSIDSFHTIKFTVSEAEVYHRLGADHFHDHREVIELEMTEAQFAQLLTTMNSGPGVPVTIRHINGKRTPKLPDIPVEAAKIRDKFRDDMEKWTTQLRTTTVEIEALLNKKGALNQVEKARVLELTSKLVSEMQGHTTFLVDQFNESVDGVLVQAKAEIEGFINAAIQRTGLKALQGQAGKLLGMDAPKKDGE